MKKETAEGRFALARRLRAVGVPLRDAEDTTQYELRIDQVGGVNESQVFDLDCGGTGYMLDLVITNNLPSPVTIFDFELEPPWNDPRFHWLDDPDEWEPPADSYFFPGWNRYGFPRKLVLNHRRRSKGELRPGAVREGLLLGWGYAPIPDCFTHGCSVDAKLSIVDRLEHRFSAEVSLWVCRSAKLIRKASKRAPLFSQPDEPFDGSRLVKVRSRRLAFLTTG